MGKQPPLKFSRNSHTTLPKHSEWRTLEKSDIFNNNEILQTKKDTIPISIDVYGIQNKIFWYLTGQFPRQSNNRNRCIFLCIVIHKNNICWSIRTKREGIYITGMQKITIYLAERGYKSKWIIIDNEASILLKTYIKNEQIGAYTLVEAHGHWVNAP